MWRVARDRRQRLDAASAERRLLQLDAIDSIDAAARQSLIATPRANGRVAAKLAATGPGGRLRGVPVDPAGAPFVIDPVTGRVGLARRVTARALARGTTVAQPGSGGRPAVMTPPPRCWSSPGVLRAGHRQLPERLHLPAAARPVARCRRRRPARRAGTRLRWFDNIPVLRWLAAPAASAVTAARRSRSAIRSSSCSPARCSCS